MNGVTLCATCFPPSALVQHFAGAIYSFQIVFLIPSVSGTLVRYILILSNNLWEKLRLKNKFLVICVIN